MFDIVTVFSQEVIELVPVPVHEDDYDKYEDLDEGDPLPLEKLPAERLAQRKVALLCLTLSFPFHILTQTRFMYPTPPLYKLRPCPSYSRCRDRINLVTNLISAAT